ncbi:hypothetical protein ACGFK1_10855 [Mycobacterium sp. NPDC048908]|uniref:hypothetical protein n=1 Tax=Mycobacterium sp. NPDC048908 TaxID=3364292 RepID=UPI00371D2746
MTDPLRKPEGLSWDPASVELPEIPMLSAGQDALSATISAVLPTLAAPLAANVATLQAKEGMFAGKLGVAQAAYQNSDDAGSQSVGHVVGMLGQLGQQAGQMGQMAGAPAQAIGGQTGMFGSLMQQAMQAAQGGGGGQPAAGAPPATAAAPSSPAAAAAAPPPVRENPAQAPQSHEPRREPLHRLETNDRAGAGPSEGGKQGHAPVKQPEHQSHRSEDDLGRRL